jgi:ABC-type branched-subunit amino acid transport system substrate-binding protein
MSLLKGVCSAVMLTVTMVVFSGLLGGALTASAADSADRAQVAMARALEHFHEGKLNEAAGLLRGFLVSHADSPMIDQAYRTLAEIHEALDEPQLALNYLAQIALPARRPSDQLMEGRLKIRIGDVEGAVTDLLDLPAESLALEERQARFLLLAAGLAEQGRSQPSLYFLYQALLTDGKMAPNDVLARIHTLMGAQMSVDDLNEAAFMYRDTPVALLAMLRLGWKALAEGQKALAQQWVAQVLDGSPAFAYRDEALTLLSQLTDTSQSQRVIGVLLPLSGKYAAFGNLVKRGLEQAREDFRPDVPVRFEYRDTAGDPEVAGQMVAELAIAERVLAIVGPLVGSAADGAVERAAREQVPLLTLSQKEGLTAASPYVFRNSLTARLQVVTLVDYAINSLGLTRFGIMHPETRQGQMMADLFSDEVERRGAILVARQGYLPEQTDFRRQVRLLQGLDPNLPDEEEDSEAEVQEGETADPKEPPPFEALFVPDYADRISLVAPQLPFYGLEGVQLLGSNGWNDPGLLKTAGNFVEGAIFVDGFFRHSPYPFVQEFAEKYFTVYGEDPTILEAQGYDAAGILLNLLKDPRINSRAGLRWALAEMPIFPGVTGATRFDFQGEAVKTLFLLQVRDGIIVQIN